MLKKKDINISDCDKSLLFDCMNTLKVGSQFLLLQVHHELVLMEEEKDRSREKFTKSLT